MLKLRFKNNKHIAVWLVEPKVTIGKAKGCDLVVDDAAATERHAEIRVAGESLTLKNLAGKAVAVNGKAVPASQALDVDDVITIGSTELQVIDPKKETKVVPTVVRNDGTTGWALKANHTALANKIFPVKNATVVGRSTDCDITLAAAHLSRRHAELRVVDGLLYVKDLGSANGTYLNGQRVSAEVRVKRGDELRFDTLSFGVIGPADDLDKTSVRPASEQQATESAPSRPASKPGSKRASAAAPRQPANPAGPASQPQRVPPVSAQNKGGGAKGIVVAVLVFVVAAAVAGWFLGQ